VRRNLIAWWWSLDLTSPGARGAAAAPRTRARRASLPRMLCLRARRLPTCLPPLARPSPSPPAIPAPAKPPAKPYLLRDKPNTIRRARRRIVWTHGGWRNSLDGRTLDKADVHTWTEGVAVDDATLSTSTALSGRRHPKEQRCTPYRVRGGNGASMTPRQRRNMTYATLTRGTRRAAIILVTATGASPGNLAHALKGQRTAIAPLEGKMTHDRLAL